MRVPIYDGPQVSQAPAPAGYQDASNYTIGDQALRSTADQVGGMADKIIGQQNQDFAWRADAKMKTDFATWESQARPKFQGAAAGGSVDPSTGQSTGTYTQAVQQYWASQASAFGQSLSPDQQRIIDRNIQMYSASTVGEATRYTMGELQKSHVEAYADANNADVQAALHSGTPAQADIAADAIRTRNAQFALQQGHINPATGQVDQDWLAAQNQKTLTVLHANMISQLQQTNTDMARQYLTDHRADIDGTQLDNIEKSLNTAEAATKAVQAVSDVFTKYLPEGADPSRGETPLNVTAMMGDIEAQFKGNPQGLAAARAELGARVNAWKTTESQFQTDAINTIEAGVAQGKGLPWAMQQPQWGTLSGKSQAAITDHLDSKAYTSLMRGNALDARSDAAAARADRALGREHYDLYLDLAMNPDKLAALTPDQVKAYLPTLGDTLTHNLMETRAKLNSSADVRTAHIDNQTFSSLAVNSFGMKDPLDPSASKQDKALFAMTKDNVDFVLGQMQAAKKAPLTNDEKVEAMRNEMARTVTVNPGWFSSNTQTPVVSLTRDQVGNVVIPAGDRQQAADALQQMHALHPADPQYAPNEANLRALYLKRVSPAGKLFSGQ